MYKLYFIIKKIKLHINLSDKYVKKKDKKVIGYRIGHNGLKTIQIMIKLSYCAYLSSNLNDMGLYIFS